MLDEESFDVFLSHSSSDKAAVRKVAERLRQDGLRVWFDEWVLKPGDSVPAKVDEGLERSRVLILCMSANAFGAEWARLESYTFRFKDPLNQSRRFVPLRLDDAEIKTSLAQFLYVDWRESADREQSYRRLREACAAHAPDLPPESQAAPDFQRQSISIGHAGAVRGVVFSPDGQCALSCSDDHTLRLWDANSGRALKIFEGHTGGINEVRFSDDGRRAISASDDHALRLWDLDSGRCLLVLEGHTDRVWSVAFDSDGRRVLSGSEDNTLRLWDLESGRQLQIFDEHTDCVWSVAFSNDGRRALSGSEDHTLRLWDLENGRALRIFEAHTDSVLSVALSGDGRRALSGSADKTLRLWDVDSGQLLKVFQGHADGVLSVTFSGDGHCALSGSRDRTLRLWDVDGGHLLQVFEGHADSVLSVAFRGDGLRALSGSDDNTVRLWSLKSGRTLRVFDGHRDSVLSVAFSGDGRRAISGSGDSTLRLWDMEDGRYLQLFEGHADGVLSVALRSDGRRALSGSQDHTVRLWDVEAGRLLRTFEGHTSGVWSVAFSSDGRHAISGSEDNTMCLWDVERGSLLRVFKAHRGAVLSVAISVDGRRAMSGSDDATLRLWDLANGRLLQVFTGHTAAIWGVAFSRDGSRAISGSQDKTVRLWDLKNGQSLRVFEGHQAGVLSVAFSGDGRRALSGSADNTLRIWDVDSGRPIDRLLGHADSVWSVGFSDDGNRVFSGADNAVIRIWNTPPSGDVSGQAATAIEVDDVQYANAKVLLVGDSGVGKSGLAGYLAHRRLVDDDKPIPSTDGAWATQWSIPHSGGTDGVDREIWLWDFAGQVDYRLVHQLFMDDTAAAVLVFNPQSENPFEGLGQWHRDLQRSSRAPFAKLLAAGRTDRGGLVVSADSLARFMREHGFEEPLHATSAKTGAGCDKLREAVIAAIDWDRIPITTSLVLYSRIKQEILDLRDRGTVLIQLAALNQRMELRLTDERFTPNQLEAAIGHLAGPGMIQRLDFGGFILLQPEVLSRYAAALVRRVRQHPQELGCILESELLSGELDYQDFKRLSRTDEEVVLRALLETVVRRGWCLRQSTDRGSLLTFPSYFRRERQQAPSHPSVLVHYRFSGPVDEIYATLVVRLHHTEAFDAKELWKDSADFQTQAGATLGFQLVREGEGVNRLDAYFEPEVDENSRVVFLRYMHDHLHASASNVERLRNYFCVNKKCRRLGQPFVDRHTLDDALSPGGHGKVFCPACGKPIVLRDNLEKKFESKRTIEAVRQMKEEGQFEIDNESRELQAVHHLGYIVAEAGQIFRPIANSDHGIDGEIEFKDDEGKATGLRLYVQIKSGDSYLRARRRDDAEVFQIKNDRWAQYWQQQAYPVMLVVRTSDQVIRWMDVSAYLRNRTRHFGEVKQIEFDGRALDVLDVRRLRDIALRDRK